MYIEEDIKSHNLCIGNSSSNFNPISVVPENIDNQLKNINNWVLFRGVPTNRLDGSIKWSKPPLQPDGTFARVNDKSTWCSFEEALQAYETGSFDGMGFVLTNETGIVALDIDHCVNQSQDNIILTQEAVDIIDEIKSYTELSPSGTGLRVLCKGSIPNELIGRKSGKFEIYDSDRFITITGQHLKPSPLTIESRPEAIKNYHLNYIAKLPSTEKEGETSFIDGQPNNILAKAFNSKNGKKIKALWEGNTLNYNYDHSAADQALCNELAFWLGKDYLKIDQMFRQSGLFRADKWDTKHSADGRTYGQMTINNAIEGTYNTYSDRAIEIPEFKKSDSTQLITFCSFADVIEKNPQPEWIIKDFIPKGEGTLISASGGVGKSMFSFFLAYNLAMDSYEYNLFDEFPMVKTGISSLFLQTENSNAQLNFRLRKIAGDNLEPLNRIFSPLFNGSAITAGKNFKEARNSNASDNFEEWFYTLINAIQDQTKKKIDLVWFDPLISFCNCNENDNTEMRQNLDVITRVSQKCEVTPVVIHHNGKDGKTYRGASAIFDWTRNLILLNKTLVNREISINGELKTQQVPAIEVLHEKCNVGKIFEPFKIIMDENFRFNKVNENVLDPKTVKICNDVRQALEDLEGYAKSQNCLIKRYRELYGYSHGAAQTHIKSALDNGFINRVKDGQLYHYKL